ncbi:hypothetical protein HKT18_06930 [Flavobacterium sp. IMCC34852]|uniref:Carboxypeptidase regulatory-like domain-containing protein n=1 Tax=Flavobacterium rivulicola TaxID=2732161 RepID=A0A7Y3R8L4_9FLAO|nr:hypothetical protein [Flavobacterium sp. IMCC34852]NNT71945.1 hypothetical protein [Flavobacterium sp. IMCC34852]
MSKNTFLLFILLIHNIVMSQDAADENSLKITSSLENYFYLEREAIHLHLDKTTFLTNEKVWYQGYIINRKTKKPFFTTNVFVVLYDEKGKQVSEKLIYAYNGIFSGVIDLDAKMTSGNYYIQVYTNWMNNFSENESAIFKINIINPVEGIKNYKKADDTSLELTLTPEGKNFVNGINNTIGIRVKDCRGNTPENLVATIQNSRGETLKSITLNASGFGKFEVNAEDDFENVTVTYKEKVLTKSIPNKQGIGFGLEVNNFSFEAKTIIKIKTNKATLDSFKAKKAYLIIHQDSKHFIYDIVLDKNNLEQSISLQNTDLFSGINTIRIIDSDLKEWANRVVYNMPKKENTISITKNFRKEDKIGFVGYSNTPNTNLSIAVVPTGTKTLSDNYNILAGLGINPYLTEPLSNANYYLLEPKRIKNYELDLFLLNQSVPKYDWENIKASKPSTNFSFDIGLTLKGNINKTVKDKTDYKVKITSFKDQIIKSTEINEKGDYVFENLILTDSTQLSLSLLKLPSFEVIETKISHQLLNRKKPFYHPFKPDLTKVCPEINSEIYAEQSLADYDLPKFTSDVIQLEEIKVEKKLTYQRSIGNGFLRGYKVDEMMENIDLLSFIERNGFTVIRRFGEATIYSRVINTLNAERPTPQIIIDGRVLMNQFEFTTMRMSDFDEIYISSNAMVPGMLNRSGIIKAYTKKTFKSNYVKSDPNNILIKEAFSLYPRFKNADYKSTNNVGFEHYGLIEWSSLLNNEEEGQFLFNITDYNKPLVKAIIEGMTPEGKLIHDEITLEMK